MRRDAVHTRPEVSDRNLTPAHRYVPVHRDNKLAPHRSVMSEMLITDWDCIGLGRSGYGGHATLGAACARGPVSWGG